mmetsp:Transcript_26218/g.37533  ORF Transcript_26218/g.37533 Transcript_26218/m.37533 type:complete len:452 (+) Transcript_26218:215-1570(+)
MHDFLYGDASATQKTMDANEIIANLIVFKMIQNGVVTKEASKLTTRWYNFVLGMSPLPLRLPESTLLPDAGEFSTKILSTFREFRKNLQKAPNHEKKHVQKACRPLWDKLREIFFDDQECRVDNAERHIVTYFEDFFDEETSGIRRCRVTGIPDCSILWNEQSIHVWELKNQHYLLDGSSEDSFTACAQIAVYMKADIESMWKIHSYLPKTSMGLLTNGSDWILVTAYSSLSNGNDIKIRWTHTPPISYSCNIKEDEKIEQEIINIIFIACQKSLDNLQELKETSVLPQLGRMTLNSLGGGKDPRNGGNNGGNGDKGPSSGGGGKGPSNRGGLAKDPSDRNGSRNNGGKGCDQVRGGRQCSSSGGSTYFQKVKQHSDVLAHFDCFENKSIGPTSRNVVTPLPLTTQNVQAIKASSRFGSDVENALKAFPIFQRLIARENVMSFTAEELFEL